MDDSRSHHLHHGDDSEHRSSSHKSWKRKYRKLRYKFEGVMKRSDELFKQDLIATAAIKRITEENNRLLDLLLDLNDNPNMARPQRHEVYVGSPTGASPERFLTAEGLENFKAREFYTVELDPNQEPTPEPEPEPEVVNKDKPEDITAKEDKGTEEADKEQDGDADVEKMEVDKAEGTTEPMDVDTEQPIEDKKDDNNDKEGGSDDPQLKTEEHEDTKLNTEAKISTKTPPILPPKTTSPKHRKRPRTIRRPISPPLEPIYHRGQTPPRFRETSPFLNPIEDEELPPGTIVHHHQDSTNTTNTFSVNTSPTATKFGHMDSNADEHHYWPRNPMSVYCWLRKYQPQVFLQDAEGGGTSGAAATGGEKKKRGSRAKQEVDDDDEPTTTTTKKTPARRRGAAATTTSGNGDITDGKASVKRKRKQQEDDDDDVTAGAAARPASSSGRKGAGGGGGRRTSGALGKNAEVKKPAAKRPRKSLASVSTTVTTTIGGRDD